MAIRAINPNITLRSMGMMWRPRIPARIANEVPLLTSIPFFTFRNYIGPRSNTAGHNAPRYCKRAWPMGARLWPANDGCFGCWSGSRRLWGFFFSCSVEGTQNVPSVVRVAAGAFGFLTSFQLFDGPSGRRPVSTITKADQKSRQAASYSLRCKSFLAKSVRCIVVVLLRQPALRGQSS